MALTQIVISLCVLFVSFYYWSIWAYLPLLMQIVLISGAVGVLDLQRRSFWVLILLNLAWLIWSGYTLCFGFYAMLIGYTKPAELLMPAVLSLLPLVVLSWVIFPSVRQAFCKGEHVQKPFDKRLALKILLGLCIFSVLNYFYEIGYVPSFLDHRATPYSAQAPVPPWGGTWMDCPVIHGALAIPPGWEMVVRPSGTRCDIFPKSPWLKLLGVRASVVRMNAPSSAPLEAEQIRADKPIDNVGSTGVGVYPFSGRMDHGPLMALPWLQQNVSVIRDSHNEHLYVLTIQTVGEDIVGLDSAEWGWLDLSASIVDGRAPSNGLSKRYWDFAGSCSMSQVDEAMRKGAEREGMIEISFPKSRSIQGTMEDVSFEEMKGRIKKLHLVFKGLEASDAADQWKDIVDAWGLLPRQKGSLSQWKKAMSDRLKVQYESQTLVATKADDPRPSAIVSRCKATGLRDWCITVEMEWLTACREPQGQESAL